MYLAPMPTPSRSIDTAQAQGSATYEISSEELAPRGGGSRALFDRVEDFDARLGLDATRLFPLDFSYTFLNHGSFGSTPHEVLAEQAWWRAEIEARPIELLGRKLPALLRDAAASVARFVGTDPDRLGFTVNATEGINGFLRSMQWSRGDEIVLLDQAYGAVRKSLLRLEHEFGIVVREASVPLPVRAPADFVHAVDAATSARTRLVVIDHVTSPSALVVPVEEIVRRAKARGVTTLVDGAHAPGSIALSIDSIGADAYAANLHKWCCAPKGAAILVVSEAWRSRVHPLATSHDYGRDFNAEFDWQGTRDPTAWLAAPAALRFFARFGWSGVRARNQALAAWAQAALCDLWREEPISPLDGSMLASMAAIRVPEGVARLHASAAEMQAWLYGSHRIEIPVIDWGGRLHVRVSAHLHTRPEDILRLGDVIREAGRAS